ncbi:hypothetical protein SBF1_50118 [Candidatus Desulfosporosinus infrequens]|uniref:Uncharacterized protein n=1 Tax=Candidatus Desulfosporosinus infrequens TaxID=2043169 RepID=A0A2U3LHA5_9FIRM|nr:hypothetical protein SBF1_50118 [Candidatus Desulfosporosinus infrequens]
MKLGKKPFKPSHKDLLYKNYRGTALPPIPATFGHQALVSNYGMLANDTLGDCVIAGSDHAVELWTAEGSKQAQFTDANAIADYSAITGYNPNDPNSDQGTDIRTALEYMRTTGMIDANGIRHKIGAYLALDQTNFNEILEAAFLLSDVKLGIQVPSTAQDQFSAGQPWTVVPGATIEGGHDVEFDGWDGTWISVITWGAVQKMSKEFFETYCDEAWAQLSTEMLNGQGLSLEGFNLTQLQADLAALTSVTPAPALVDYFVRVTGLTKAQADSVAAGLATMGVEEGPEEATGVTFYVEVNGITKDQADFVVTNLENEGYKVETGQK